MGSPATFQPQTIDLSAGAIQLIRTALANPKVTFDKTGLKSTDAAGNLLVDIEAAGSANLTGTITALGLSLPGGIVAQGPGPNNTIEWTRTADGVAVASIIGEGPQNPGDLPGRTELLLQALAPDRPGTGTQLYLTGNEVGGGGGAHDYIQAVADGNVALIIDDTSRSSFLQLLSAQKLQLQIGNTVLNWPNNANDVTAVINHGLGTTPKLVIAPAQLDVGVRSWQTFIGNTTATQFTLLARPDGVFNGNWTFPWAVIG